MGYCVMRYIGAHMSITGGFHKAIERVVHVGGNALQIFCKNQRQWNAVPLSEGEVSKFRTTWQAYDMMPVAVHAGYLINLASPDDLLNRRSVEAFVVELERTARLGISMIILHPGFHRGSGITAGIERFVSSLDFAISRVRLRPMWIILETTAGQGSALGSSFDELAEIIFLSRHSNMLGVCIDTAHIFAAGYDIRTEEAYYRTMKLFDDTIGFDRLKFIHLNDSASPLGSRIDRHTHIGKGKIGLNGFKLIINDSRLAHLPMVIETPKGRGLEMDRINISLLRSLIS